MTVTLGALTLDDNLQLRGVEAMSLATVNVSRTILGRTILDTAPAPAGHPLELTADRDGDGLRGLFLQSQINAINALRAAVTQVTLAHPRWTGQVIVVGVGVEPVFDVNNPPTDWWFSGSIQLLTV